MGFVVYESEDAFAVPPARLFKALVLEAQHLLPKIFQDFIKNVEVLEGNGGPGSTVRLTFAEGGKVSYVKHEIEEIDKVNFKISYSVVEGDVILGDKLEKISYKLQLVPSPDGGSICKNVTKYHPKGDIEVTEEDFKTGKEKAVAMVRVIEAYVQANPDF